jgi:apolipoprotein N-acyltransferase
MACMRGIELGCSVIRHTGTGLSAAVDYQGRLLAQMDHFTTPGTERVMVTHVPVHGVPTFYARFGDLFSWICVAGLLVPDSRRPRSATSRFSSADRLVPGWPPRLVAERSQRARRLLL